MDWWIWVVIGIVLLAVELMSTTLHVGFFAAGAFFVGLLKGFGWNPPLWQELLLFTVFSLVALFFIRPVISRKLRLHESKVVDTMIGEQATAMDDIDVQATGKAEMRGSTWNAQNIGTTKLSRGQRARVERVEGLVIYIKGS